MNKTTLHNGDCVEVLKGLPASSVDSIITDPPYGLHFMGKEWDKPDQEFQHWTTVWAREALRVAKPGAILLAFGGTRTFHRLTCAIEDAGFEIRDCIMWLYGTGFPKSHDIAKGIDKAAGAVRDPVTDEVVIPATLFEPERRAQVVRRATNDAGNNGGEAVPFMPPGSQSYDILETATDEARAWEGYGTALKPAWEPIIVAMKPLDGTFAQNAEAHGVAGMWIDGARVAGDVPQVTQGATDRIFNGDKGLLTKPSLSTPSPAGRWPANLILDEDAGAMLDEQSGERRSTGDYPSESRIAGMFGDKQGPLYSDSGGASRFFYCAKASRSERNAGLDWMPEQVNHSAYGEYAGTPEHVSNNGAARANNHPTVKPLKLMQYLARITRTPEGGVVLDPFMGSGTTGIAALAEGRDFIGIERDPDYFKIAEARLAHHAHGGRQTGDEE